MNILTVRFHQGSSTRPADISPTSTDVSSTLAEQIRQFIATTIVKPNSSITDTLPTPLSTQTSLDKLSDIVKLENGNHPHVKDTTNEYFQPRQQPQSPFVFPKNEAVPVVIPPFNYSSGSFPTTNFSSFNSLNSSMTSKPTSSVPVQNFLSQPSQFFYPSGLNSNSTDATAAILQAYSQFNVQATPTIIHQPLTTTQTQHQIRK